MDKDKAESQENQNFHYRLESNKIGKPGFAASCHPIMSPLEKCDCGDFRINDR